jgi:hypothetical protein
VSDSLLLLAGAYIAWELHIGSHYCKTSTGEGSCDVGDELLRRLHTAYAMLDADERKTALEAVRGWDWKPAAPYRSDT